MRNSKNYARKRGLARLSKKIDNCKTFNSGNTFEAFFLTFFSKYLSRKEAFMHG